MIEKTMQAMMLLGEGQLELQEVPVPVPAEGEVLVKVQAATTCGTDVKIFRRGHPKFPLPFIFGHEFGGDIAAVGPGVEKFSLGLRVTANVFCECGTCFYCQKGQGNLCENLGYNFGAFAQYHLIPASIVNNNLFVIPEHISYSEAAVLEPLVSVVHAARQINVQAGERVAVIGAGGAISLLFIQLLRNAGASEVIAIGHSDLRLAAAAELGADVLINAKYQAAQKLVYELTSGRGVDVAIECAGTTEAWQSAVEMIRRGGRVLWFGGLPGGSKVAVDATKVHYGEITLLNSHGGTKKDAAFAFDLITSGKVNTQALITEERGLSQVGEAIEKMIAGQAIKIAIRPNL
jgi:L-iditol 2-dehydrogenase